ncbi:MULTISPECIES: MFS transporter [Clostridium]|jgi:MFS family permease|uniref:MFS transporter n=1 Tax=Clostridium TaxID=1485 RepID=UPI000E4D59F9|nr:MFS transporter [Clostridium fessum]RHP58746.1 MFS transporter [Clostridium sp. AF29-8BH]
MKEQMKKIALLSLSLILTSAYSVSIVLPSLLQHFSEYTTAQVEMLISAPSFAITVMIVLNAWLSRYMKDRSMIVGGLLLLSVSGMVPVFVQEYPVMFASRIFLGIGIGLINAKAISIFSEYYEGREKAALLGYRGSAEVLGSAVMTLVAGKLVLIRWNLAFWVYALGFVIVLLYLVWVPGSMEPGQSAGAEKESLEAEADGKRECWKKEVLPIAYAVFAGFVICIYCSNSLRVPMLILEKKLGTESEASIILTLMMLMGIAAGVYFGKLTMWWKEKLPGVGCLMLGAGMLLTAYAGNLPLIGVGISIVGFFYTVLVTYSFHQISERIPQSSINTATSIVLVGCNLGAACSPFVLKWMGRFSEGVSVPFVGYAGMMGVLGIVLIVVTGRKK